MTKRERDSRDLQRRLEVLRLPIRALRFRGYISSPNSELEWGQVPTAVGVGPNDVALAVWASQASPRRQLVTTHGQGADILGAVVLEGALKPHFVQPLPGDRFLLVPARALDGQSSEVWDSDGQLQCAGQLGDAITELLTTPSGKVWVGYFDEAWGGTGPQTHGLARFTSTLDVDWVYPESLRPIFTVYALNVADETVHCCAYDDYHLVSVFGDEPVDRGALPHFGVTNLVIDDPAVALVGRYGPEYDLVASLRLHGGAILPTGANSRLVLSDGIEVRNARVTCRGANIHVFANGSWYTLNLRELH